LFVEEGRKKKNKNCKAGKKKANGECDISPSRGFSIKLTS
jgi:hypothetical protein